MTPKYKAGDNVIYDSTCVIIDQVFESMDDAKDHVYRIRYHDDEFKPLVYEDEISLD